MLAYAALFLTLTFPYWLLGEVVAPHRQALELAAPPAQAPQIENRKFSDYNMGYVPEIIGTFRGKRSGWLALWTDKNEIGRPLDHTSGFSPAYLPSWILGSLARAPERFITVASLGMCFLAGIFVLMLCAEMGLSRWSGLLAAASLASCPFFMYWLPFPFFIAAYCWSAGALYAVTRLARQPDLAGWGLLAFSTYSLLMTAYQQLIVFHAYLLLGYGLWLVRQQANAGARRAATFAALAASALCVAVALSLPLYLDLARIASESARVSPDAAFFTANFPRLDTLKDFAAFVVLGTYPEVLGNPIAPSFPLVYNGRSVTPLVIFLSLVALAARFRQTWGWWLAIAILCALLFHKPLYEFGVRHLGFNLSRSNPIGILILPVCLIAAHGADALLQPQREAGIVRAIALAAAGTLGGAVLAVVFALAANLPVRWGVVALACVATTLLAAQWNQTRPVLLLAALVLIGAYVSFPLMLRQDEASIARTSPLVEELRARLPEGSRLAMISPVSVLPPNMNATVGIASIHSYNSLSSRRYHELVRSLGGDVHTYGRLNQWIAPDYGGLPFWMSDIALVLSSSPLMHENLRHEGRMGDLHLHRVVSRMGCCRVLSQPPATLDGGAEIRLREADAARSRPLAKVRDEGDSAEFELAADGPALLFLSQRFDRDWNATVLASAGWETAKTLLVNGVFQGVLLPEGARRVRMQFQPLVRHAWVAHVFWLLLATVVCVRMLRRNPPRAAT